MTSQYGAHLSSTTGLDRPSIFEVVAQDSLATTLRQAIKFLAGYCAQTWPERFSGIYRRSDELVLVLETFLQYYHLRKYQGSFSEHFYGLARTSRTQFLRSVLLLSLLPYLLNKLKQSFAKLQEDEENELRTKYQSLRTAYLRFYPHLHFLVEGSYFTTMLLYALGRIDFHSPSLYFSGSKLEHDNDSKHLRIDEAEPPRVWYFLPIALTQRLASKTAEYSSTALVTGSFLIQFLEWWYQNNDLSPFTKGSEIPPSPSAISSNRELSAGRELAKGKCPICSEDIRNEAVLATSGISFCYACIFKRLLEDNCCPVTGYPSSVDCLIKVYRH